jgi:hypothetical protein
VRSGKQAWVWVAMGCGALALIAYFNGRNTHQPIPVPEPNSEVEQPLEAAASATEPPPSEAASRPSASSTRAIPSSSARPDNVRPPCKTDDECKGPRHAECIDIKCVNGTCVYDESHCQCVSNDDCDDGDPCTRNHCFSSTQKCIYIPIDDCK